MTRAAAELPGSYMKTSVHDSLAFETLGSGLGFTEGQSSSTTAPCIASTSTAAGC